MTKERQLNTALRLISNGWEIQSAADNIKVNKSTLEKWLKALKKDKRANNITHLIALMIWSGELKK